MADVAISSEDAAAPESVAATLRERIMVGTLGPGARLTEVALAAELGVSRNTLRMAFQLLRADGVVTVQRHRGATVRVMAADNVRDIYVVRRTLELRAVEDSGTAPRCALAQLVSRVNDVETAAREERWPDAATASLRFHEALVASMNSPLLDGLFANVLAQIRLAFAAAPDEREFQRPYMARDREICNYIIAGARSTAVAILRDYLDESENALMARLGVIPRGCDT